MEGSTIVPVKWAQCKASLFLTLDAQNVSEDGRMIEISPEGHLHFEGTSKDASVHYRLDMDLFDEVDSEHAKWKVTDLHIALSIPKKNKDSEYWPRVLKEKGKFNWVSVDWGKWVDEDDETAGAAGMGGMNLEDYDDLPDSDDEEEEEVKIDDLDEPKKD